MCWREKRFASSTVGLYSQHRGRQVVHSKTAHEVRRNRYPQQRLFPPPTDCGDQCPCSWTPMRGAISRARVQVTTYKTLPESGPAPPPSPSSRKAGVIEIKLPDGIHVRVGERGGPVVLRRVLAVLRG
jgi:hypothetical protein